MKENYDPSLSNGFRSSDLVSQLVKEGRLVEFITREPDPDEEDSPW